MRIRKWGNREITSVLGDGETGHRGASSLKKKNLGFHRICHVQRFLTFFMRRPIFALAPLPATPIISVSRILQSPKNIQDFPPKIQKFFTRYNSIICNNEGNGGYHQIKPIKMTPKCDQQHASVPLDTHSKFTDTFRCSYLSYRRLLIFKSFP